jgi:hypothetical protein
MPGVSGFTAQKSSPRRQFCQLFAPVEGLPGADAQDRRKLIGA